MLKQSLCLRTYGDFWREHDMRWPWTRPEEEIKKEEKEADEARVTLKIEIGKLDKLLDKIESNLEKGVANGKT